MRILTPLSIVLIGTALSLPAAACDRHGGAFGQFGGASWADYDPMAAESDALFLEQQLSKWHKQNEAPAVKDAKPNFSQVTNRASIAAKARLAKRAQLSNEAKDKPAVILTKAAASSKASASR